MIDETLFQNWMTALGTRFGKPLDEHAAFAYYESLSQRLDDAGFARGAKKLFDSHRFATWPAPDEFVEAAGGAAALDRDSSGAAAAAWLVIDETFRMRPPRWTYADCCGKVTESLGGDVTAVTCLRLVGGDAAMKRRKDGETDWLRKEFLAMWPDAVRIAHGPPEHGAAWVQGVVSLPPPMPVPKALPRSGTPNEPVVSVQEEIAPRADGGGGRAQFLAELERLRNEVSPMSRALRRAAETMTETHDA